MPDDLPAEIDPDDLPDDPELLKRLVCELYATVVASEELVAQSNAAGAADETGLGWLTNHLAEESPVRRTPEE